MNGRTVVSEFEFVVIAGAMAANVDGDPEVILPLLVRHENILMGKYGTATILLLQRGKYA